MTADYQRKTDAELQQLAEDMASGRVFSSGQCREDWRPMDAFVPLLALFAEDRLPEDVAMVYERRDPSNTWTMGPKPIFMTMHWLDVVDFERLRPLYAAAVEARTVVLRTEAS